MQVVTSGRTIRRWSLGGGEQDETRRDETKAGELSRRLSAQRVGSGPLTAVQRNLNSSPKVYAFSPAHLFPFGHSYFPAAALAPCSSVALSGPLPHSSLLHLALHHLHEEPATPTQSTEGASAATARQQLDEARERRVLILTSDQALLRDQLADERDIALAGNRRSAEQVRLLDRIDIK